MGYQYVQLGTFCANGQALDTGIEDEKHCQTIAQWDGRSEIDIKDTVEGNPSGG